MSSPALVVRNPSPVPDFAGARRRTDPTIVPMDRVDAGTARSETMTIDGMIREIGELRMAVRTAFLAASPEYQLLFELTENGLRDCAKCLRELEARAAQHPYNKMLIKIDAAYDAMWRAAWVNVPSDLSQSVTMS